MGTVLVSRKMNMTQQVPTWQWKSTLSVIGKTVPAGWERWTFPSAPVRSPLEYRFMFWAPQYRKDMGMLVYIQYVHPGHREDMGLGASVIWRKAGRAEFLYPGEGSGGILISIYKCLVGETSRWFQKQILWERKFRIHSLQTSIKNLI